MHRFRFHPIRLFLLIALLAAAGCAGTRSGGVPEEHFPEAGIPAVPAPAPDILPEAAGERERLVDYHLNTMSLQQRIAQRFIIYVPRGTSRPDGRYLSLISDLGPAGMIIYSWNYETSGQVRTLTGLLQNIADRDLQGRRFLICADQEGGRVSAFRFNDVVRLPSAWSMGRHNDPDFIRSLAYVTAVEMRSMGVNMNLAPVLDLTAVPDSTVIGDRSMGYDPAAVSALGEAYVQAFRQAGVIATAKHFPGHGVTTVDSHVQLPSVDLVLDELASRDLMPFARAIDAGVPVVMTAHILYPAIDPEYPVTISEPFINTLLRGELGFDGVVMTDGLEMGAIADRYDLDTTLFRLFTVGVDLILLYSRYDLYDVVSRVEQMMAAGRVSPADIDTGVRRILELKYDYGLLDSSVLPQ